MEFLKVTDNARVVTDPVLLSMLAGQGIARDGVALEQDYGPRALGTRRSPYAKLYRDLNSDKMFTVVSGLPMVDAYGQSHELTWQDRKGKIVCGNNIFHAIISGLDTRLVALNDQPGSIRKNGEVFFHPQLFIGESEVRPLSLSPSLLETDPVNENYHNNVLEWDYGICKRRLRLIEGRFLGSWVFVAHPHADVRIRYNQSGDFSLRLGQFAVSPDEEFIPAACFANPVAGYPVIISDTATFYPDADTETNSCDGLVRRTGSNLTWPDIRDGAGTSSFDTQASANLYLQAGASSGWALLHRLLFFFYLAGLSGTVNAATLSLYGSVKSDGLGDSPSIDVYGCNSSSATSLTSADYGTVLSTAFASAIPFASFNAGGYNDFALNSNGLANIPLSGLSRFCARLANSDVANSPPSFSPNAASYFTIYMAEQGSGYKPKLVVTYSTGENKTSADTGNGAEVIVVRSLDISESGFSTDVSRAAVFVSAGDTGSGNENSSTEAAGPCESVSSGDAGKAADALKSLVRQSGIDMKFNGNPGQLGLPDKEVRL
jgi:hypothetical protein